MPPVQTSAQNIEQEPEALRRYPNFFKILPRRDFENLKQRYQNQPESRETQFLHMGMTPSNQDFRWEQSCDRVSGECNPAAHISYHKGNYVPPEDLRTIAKELDQAKQKAVAMQSHADLAKQKLSRSIFGQGGAERLSRWIAQAFSNTFGSGRSALARAAVATGPAHEGAAAAREPPSRAPKLWARMALSRPALRSVHRKIRFNPIFTQTPSPLQGLMFFLVGMALALFGLWLTSKNYS